MPVEWRKLPMSIRNKRTASIATLLLVMTFVTVAAIPDAAWARPGGSHHESNQGEVFKPGFWEKVVKLIKVYIQHPITIVPGGGSSSPVCH
jgi:hypothetical protein